MPGELAGPDSQLTEKVDVTITAKLHNPSLPLLLALPKKPDAVFRLATMPLDLGESPAEPDWLQITVGKRAPVKLLDGIELDGWEIELQPEGEGPTTTLWLAEEEPYILRRKITMPGFGVIVWKYKIED